MTTVANIEKTTRGRHKLVRTAAWSLLVLVLLVLTVSIWTWWRVRACLPQLDGAVRLEGLGALVDVFRDARGVPHIRAESVEDAYFAQGYVTAQDRLWQMDLSRRLAQGELSEIFGRRALEADIENRKLGFSQAAARGAQELSPEFERLLGSYARGVNAFIATHSSRLPVEFSMLRYRPRPWSDIDSISIALNMAKMLNSSWELDLARERVRARLTPELYSDLFPDDSPLEHPVAEEVAGPPRAVSSDAARLMPLPAFEQGLDSTLDALLPGDSSGGPKEIFAAQEMGSAAINEEDELALGSNNWVVSGSRTASGKPLLSNDPHLGHRVPSIWYMVHLGAPGLDVSGVSLPGAPAVIIGHNDRIAWGMTNTGPDVQDLYIEKFNPANPNEYLHNGKWMEAETRDELIRVRGEKDYHLSVRVTRHGPVISEEGGRALALSWTALQPHALEFPFLAIDEARNWQEFAQAIRQFTGPEQNMVYADVDGNIGYYAPGWVPVRRGGDGSVPVPGDTDAYDWMGYIPFEDLPHSYNPAAGLIATANSRVIPKDYPYFFTQAWTAPYRTARIFDLLEAGTPGRSCPAGRLACFTVDDMLRIDSDIHPLDDVWLAAALVRAAGARPPDHVDPRQAIDLVAHWNGVATADSPVPLICQNTWAALRERLLEPKLGAEMARRNWSLSAVFIQKVIDEQLTRWLPPGDADFNATLVASLEEGLGRIEKRFPGRDISTWRWGDTIPLIFHHPLDSVPAVGRLFDVGPYAQAGTADCVKATTPGSGPSMRMVADLSNWDASVQNLTLGESGQIASPYYHDQFRAWYSVRSFPMLFSGEAVERGASHRLTLEPVRR